MGFTDTPIHIVSRQAVYNVPSGTNPSTIPFSGTTSRLVVKFDTAGVGIGTLPYKIKIPYKRVGNPSGTLRVGIRKAAGDTFQLIAEYHIVAVGTTWITTGGGPYTPVWNNITIEAANEYQMVANDKLSLEYTPDATNTIEIGTSTTQSNPSGFTSQSFTGTYTNTTNPLAISITSRVLSPI